MALDVTDETFEADVLDRSVEHAVVIDLWAPWCGPCRTLGPVIERLVDETNGAVELVKVNVDENPRISASFEVQSIPAVYAIKDRKVVDAFIGAQPEAEVRDFIAKLTETSPIDQLVDVGDEASLRRALELAPDHPGAVTSLAALLLDRSEPEEALELLAKIPESAETRPLAARARLALRGELASTLEDGQALEVRLQDLLERVRSDDAARQEYLDLIEALGPDDPRRETFRRALAARLF